MWNTWISCNAVKSIQKTDEYFTIGRGCVKALFESPNKLSQNHTTILLLDDQKLRMERYEMPHCQGFSFVQGNLDHLKVIFKTNDYKRNNFYNNEVSVELCFTIQLNMGNTRQNDFQ